MSLFPKKFNVKAFMLVIGAALFLEATTLVQFYFSYKGLREEASRKAESQLAFTRDEIMDVVNQTESAVRNNIWIAQWCLDFPDSLKSVCRRLVEYNPVVAGSTVAFVPGRIRGYPRFAPYVCRSRADSLQFLSLDTPEYDYPSQEWFMKPVELGRSYWSEPYVDEGGGDILMTTFSMPIQNYDGKTAAVITADVSLEWLAQMVDSLKAYPNARCTIFSKSGREMVSPPEREDDDGSGTMVFNSIVERTGWTMSIEIPKDDIFQGLRRIGIIVTILQLMGLVMIVLMVRSFVVGQLKIREEEQVRERMERELHIASGIQMSMVPKVFPPFPERTDLDMAATIVPAKEVGGALYDFFLRDEKLFFCVGDVSGKGVPAALVMAVTRTTFRNMSAREDSPGRIVQAMNDGLCAVNENEMFVTFFCGVLDLANSRLTYCNAGHNPPMILTDSIQPLPVVPNLPLGIMAGMEYQEQETPFFYDDALFLYTDGLTEAENIAHEQFGEERMLTCLHGRKSAQGHLDNIKRQVAAFVGDAPQSDDLTLLFIHYLPALRRLVLHNRIDQISLLPDFVDEAVGASKIDPAVGLSLNLALEEAVTNVISYAYPEGTDGEVEIEAIVGEHALTFMISDSGKPFDPTARDEVDITASVEDRPIGGLGIHLIRQIMDAVLYERVRDKNVLYLTKNY